MKKEDIKIPDGVTHGEAFALLNGQPNKYKMLNKIKTLEASLIESRKREARYKDKLSKLEQLHGPTVEARKLAAERAAENETLLDANRALTGQLEKARALVASREVEIEDAKRFNAILERKIEGYKKQIDTYKEKILAESVQA